MAVAFVASPLYVRQAIASFEAVDQTLVDASARSAPARRARSGGCDAAGLGWSRRGGALAFARGLGEFGATIMFAEAFGITRRSRLAIYNQFETNFDVALAIGGLLVVVSAALLLALKIGLGWKSSASTSPFLFARTPSS
jgi:molybdate transport system permease protein